MNGRLIAGLLRDLTLGRAGFVKGLESSGLRIDSATRSDLFYCHGMGELRTLLPLLHELAKDPPAGFYPVLIVYGRDLYRYARSLSNPPFRAVHYSPYYDAGSIRRSFTALKAKSLVIVESDLTPLYLQVAQQLGVKRAVLNGSFGHWRDRRFHGLAEEEFARLLVNLDLVTFKDRSVRAQLSAYERRLASAVAGNLRGVPVVSTGLHLERNFADKLAKAREKSFLVVAGSTYANEDEIIFAALGDDIRAGAIKVVIAPRKLIRIPALFCAATARGLKPVKRSALAASAALPPLTILDSMGELTGLYAHADVAFVGGTIRDKGGHNLFEPAACGVPVLFGPHYGNNFDFAEELLRSRGGECVADSAQLRLAVTRWRDDRVACRGCGAAARESMARGKAILDATALALHNVLADSSSALPSEMEF